MQVAKLYYPRFAGDVIIVMVVEHTTPSRTVMNIVCVAIIAVLIIIPGIAILVTSATSKTCKQSKTEQGPKQIYHPFANPTVAS